MIGVYVLKALNNAFYKKECVRMTKAELVAAVAEKTGETKKAVAAVVEEVMVQIKGAKKVSLVGFGTFTMKKRAARMGRNPSTGEAIPIPEKTVLTFKASKAE